MNSHAGSPAQATLGMLRGGPRCGGLMARLLLVVACVCGTLAHAQAQTPSVPQADTPQFLSGDEIHKRYRHCPDGYYSGPQPGKAQYTKDPWMWVVTPEFARRFCMPPEYVSTELKGAEAIAYKLIEDQDEEICGWGGRATVCRKATDHRFEIYYKTGTIPKERPAPYYFKARVPSRMLISITDKTFQNAFKRARERPRLGAISPFYNQQFGLQAINEGKVAWPLGTLGAEIHFEELFDGIDFVAMQGGSGFSRREGWAQAGTRQMVISVRRTSLELDNRKSYGMALGDFALVIELPKALSERVIEVDQSRGLNLRALADEALQPSRGSTAK